MVSPVAPGLVITGMHSQVGKTLVTAGLLRAFRNLYAPHGSVVGFKVGPDYIDPGYHQVASGQSCRNLDPVLCDEDAILPLYRYGAEGHRLALVEGVMGLYDGRMNLAADAPRIPYGSTAHVAQLLTLPIVLVVDGSHTSDTLAALLYGIRTYPAVDSTTPLRFAGALINRVKTTRHAAILEHACQRAGFPVLGTIPTLPAAERPSRHLGLITTAEAWQETDQALESFATHLQTYCDLEVLANLAQPAAPAVDTAPWNPADALRDNDEHLVDCPPGSIPAAASPPALSPTIVVCGGPAFSFTYPEEVELLRAAGAHIHLLDPATDQLPDSAAGLLIPGGFPEEHLTDLTRNHTLLTSIRAAATAGMPIWAECAGLVYLSAALDGTPLAGVLPCRTTFSGRLTLGYREATCTSASWAFHPGERISGHEFHRTHITEPPDSHRIDTAWQWENHDNQNVIAEGWASPTLYASYLHTHPVARPAVAQHFVHAAQHYHKTREGNA